METVQIIALTMGTAWASGINVYAAVFMLGYLGSTGHVVLPDELGLVTDPLVMTVAGTLYCIEFCADKIPGLDSTWDAIHTFIRIPAGAMLAMSAVSDVTPAMELAAFLLGGGLAASTHATKAGGRILVNSSPEPVSNWAASIFEDLLVIGGMWTALYHPQIFLGLLMVFVLCMAWLLPTIGKGIKKLINLISRLFNPERPRQTGRTPAPTEDV